jgi:DNA-binding CsgD family transcriptional regulator
VFCGQAHPFERTRPFGVVAAALDLSRRSPDPRRAAIGELLASEGAGAPARAAGDIQYRVVEEIVDLVEASCAERPVLLVAEDIHWADSASLLAILSVARQLPPAALLVVVTARPSPLPAEVVRLLDDLAAAGARTLQLQPLKSDDVAVLARHLLGASPGPVLTAVLAKAGGNPSWAVAMLRSLADEGMLRRAGGTVEVTTLELPTSLSDLVVRRLRHLPAATLELLQVTAVLGGAVSLRDVAAVARRPPAEVVGQLGDAFDAQLLDEADDLVVFRHQLVHDAIYQHTPPPARRLLHREAAVALMAAGADRLDVADHLMLGAERGDEQAVAWLRDIARETSARSPLVAVQLIRRAEALLPGGHRDADLVSSELVQSCLALFDCDLVGEARAAYREALDAESGSLEDNQVSGSAGVLTFAVAGLVATVRSVALRCQGLVNGEIEPMMEAVAFARRAPLLADHAGACEDAARLLAQGGRRNEAATLLAEALERYEQAGADAWAGRVRGQLRALGASPGPQRPRRRPAGGWESLTAAERAVSVLVAEGLTNGAVARRLFISPHTVNTHLRHVFAKLSVPNRVALAAVVYHSIK